MAVLVKGGGCKPEEEKTVTAGTSAIEVSPSTGKVIKKVTVNPTPSQSKTVTPTTGGVTVNPDDGYLISSVEVDGDANLIADNIKNGVSIFGITGTAKGGFPNGTKWTQSNITSGNFYSIFNANGIWVAGSKGLYYSTNGMTWTQSNITSENFYSVYNANGIWVAGGYGNGLYYSVTWGVA